MKFNWILFLVPSIFLFINCGDNEKNNKPEATLKKSNAENNAGPSSAATTVKNSINGIWKLSKEVFDDNGNRIPDEAELKKAYSNNYTLELNADGTCKIQQMFTGRYEKKTENGRNMLYVYRKKVAGEEDQDPPPDIFQITSLKPDELILQIIEAGEPSSFWFFKRL